MRLMIGCAIVNQVSVNFIAKIINQNFLNKFFFITGYLYDSENDQCYKAYRQGPCSTGQYLAFSDNSLKAECQPNDCSVDGQVRFREKCYELGSNGPCAVDKLLPIFTKLNINETTLQIECVVSTLSESGSRFGEEDSKNSELTVVSKYPAAACFRGSRRAYLNQCSQLNSGYPSHDNF